MAKFNAKTAKTTQVVENYNGGKSVKFKPEFELISMLFDGLTGQFYEKESDREKRLIDLIKEVGKKDPELVAKALVYTRSVIGQRSITHVGAVAALPILSGTQLGAKFFSKRNKEKKVGGIVYRLDDMLEIVSYYYLRNPNKPLPNSIKKGFKSALENADEFELAKYQGKGKEVSMVDLVNLVHPKPNEKMQEAFKKLMNGELKQFNTAEDKNTKSGQIVAEKVKSGEITKTEAVQMLNEAKAENWKDLIVENKIGYLALLRNLRNIATIATDDVFSKALVLLTDPKRIKESLVFPHQIDIAFEVLLSDSNLMDKRRVDLLLAVNTAYELAIPNLKELFTHGRTAIVIDSSGSMTSNIHLQDGKQIKTSAIQKAGLIGATLAKGIGGDLYHFSTSCSSITYNPIDSVNTIKNTIVNRSYGGGTSFNTIFNTLNGKYDRVFIISDMQGSDELLRGSSYQTYIKTQGQPMIYSINLCGYGTTMFKQTNKVVNIFGYSKDIYEYIKVAEIDPNYILSEIRKIVI